MDMPHVTPPAGVTPPSVTPLADVTLTLRQAQGKGAPPSAIAGVDDPATYERNVENFVGTVRVPVGLAAQPDATLQHRRNGVVQARCALWWRATPLHAGRRTGFIGAVESSDDGALGALRGFARAPLFAPIGLDAFAALYRPLVPLLDPRLCPVAECDGRIAGVLFALRDPSAPRTVVLKTVVRDPDRRFAGLGFVLTGAARAAAHALGATRAISALQHDGNVARSLAPRAIPFRRYAVFAKELS
jgi:GNAT superfamily N-acetyltransferase